MCPAGHSVLYSALVFPMVGRVYRECAAVEACGKRSNHSTIPQVSQTLRCGLYREYFASTAYHTVSVHSPNPATLTICAGAGVNWHLRGGKENGMSAERESSLRGTVIIIMPIRTRGKKKKRKDSIQWRIRQRRDPVETKKRYER